MVGVLYHSAVAEGCRASATTASRRRTRLCEPCARGLARVIETFREIRRHREVFVFLLAFWCYNDGINTIIKMATIYGAEIGIGQNDLIGALLLVQFVGIPATFAFGALAARIGPKRGVYLALAVYTGISILGFLHARSLAFFGPSLAASLWCKEAAKP